MDEFWVNDTPDIIQVVLLQDGCTIERGLDFMSLSVYSQTFINNNIGRNDNTLT